MICDTNLMSTLIINMCPVAEQLWTCREFSDENVMNMYQRLENFDELLLSIEPEIDHKNSSLMLPEMCKCLESIWGGFTKGHPRNSIDRRCNVEMRKIEDCVLPESRFARKLYDYTKKMIHAIVNDEDNPYSELIYGEYKALRTSVSTYNYQKIAFEEKMNEIYPKKGSTRKTLDRSTIKSRRESRKRSGSGSGGSNNNDNSGIGMNRSTLNCYQFAIAHF